jgi:hypothetical protein
MSPLPPASDMSRTATPERETSSMSISSGKVWLTFASPTTTWVTVPVTPDTLMTVTSRRFFTERKRIVEFAGKYRLPAIYFQKEFVDEGGLMSYGVEFGDQFRKAAH